MRRGPVREADDGTAGASTADSFRSVKDSVAANAWLGCSPATRAPGTASAPVDRVSGSGTGPVAAGCAPGTGCCKAAAGPARCDRVASSATARTRVTVAGLSGSVIGYAKPARSGVDRSTATRAGEDARPALCAAPALADAGAGCGVSTGIGPSCAAPAGACRAVSAAWPRPDEKPVVREGVTAWAIACGAGPARPPLLGPTGSIPPAAAGWAKADFASEPIIATGLFCGVTTSRPAFVSGAAAERSGGPGASTAVGDAVVVRMIRAARVGGAPVVGSLWPRASGSAGPASGKACGAPAGSEAASARPVGAGRSEAGVAGAGIGDALSEARVVPACRWSVRSWAKACPAFASRFGPAAVGASRPVVVGLSDGIARVMRR